MTEDDLEEGTEEYVFYQSVPDSPASKKTAQEKRKELNVDTLNLRAFFQRIYEDDNEDRNKKNFPFPSI